MTMSDGVNFTPYQVGGNDGGGFGGMGGIGGVLIGALLGRGLLGGEGRRDRDGGDCVTPAQFISGLNNVTDNVSTTAILGKLGSIEAAIPLGAAQTENVILQQTNALNGGLASLALGTQQGFANTKDAVQAGTLANCIGFSTTNSNVDRGNFALATQMAAGFNQTQELINRINTDNISRQLTVAENALLEERFGRRTRESEINIVNTNTAVATATQSQAQAQQQTQLISQLLGRFVGLENDIQTVKQGQVIFNSGVMAASGTQAAANTKVA